MPRRRCGQRDRAGAPAVADGIGGNAVLGELIDERAGEDAVEEGVQLWDQVALGRLLPGAAPEDGEDLDSSQQRAVAVGELRPGRRLPATVTVTGEVIHRVDGDDADRIVVVGDLVSGHICLLLCTTS